MYIPNYDKQNYLRFVIISLFAVPNRMPVTVQQQLATDSQEAGVVAQQALVARHETQIPEKNRYKDLFN